MGPFSASDRHDLPGLIDEPVPGFATQRDDIVVGLEYPVGKPVIAHELPYVFDGVQLGRSWWQEHQCDVGWDLKPAGGVPSGPADDEYSVSAWCHQGRDFIGYASNRGVPLLVLTDGNRWDFYLSMAEGVPSERRFYRLELQLEHKIPEYVDFLDQHLRKRRVVSGEARVAAEQRHASNRERKRAHQAIPRTWQTLLKEPDETLRDLLAEMVESECGTKPELDDVEVFLRNLVFTSLPPKSGSGPSVPSPDPDTLSSGPSQLARTRIVGFILGEEHVEAGTAIGTLAELLTRLEREVPEFMERFALKTISRNRNLVARNPAELYEKSHLVDKHSKELRNGWWLGENGGDKLVHGSGGISQPRAE